MQVGVSRRVSRLVEFFRSGRAKEGLRVFGRVLRNNPRLLTGLMIVSIAVFFALFAPLIAPFDPESASDQVLHPPGSEHWLGTDRSGMDIFSRIIYAPRIDLTIAIAATVLSIAIGLPVGVMSGYYTHISWYTNIFSETAMRIADLLQSFPVFILGMSLVVLTGQRIENVVIALAIVSAPIYARLTRSQAIYVKERLYVEAARASGSSNLGVVFRHLLPNCLGPAFAFSSVTVGFSILLTSGLSFVGAGVRVPTPEWGSMIAIGTPNLFEGGKWWPSVFPGLALSVTVIGFGLMGDSLAEITDPRRRRTASHA